MFISHSGQSKILIREAYTGKVGGSAFVAFLVKQIGLAWI